MPFCLIKGTFHVQGYQPDGDSIRFHADNGSHWVKLRCPYVELNARDHAQLRIEAIDTLETHYQGVHQPLVFARQALDFLLGGLGITDVEWNLSTSNPRVTHANDGTPGFILTRAAERYHRPIAYVFAGDIDKADGDEKIVLDTDLLKQSMNYKLVEAGMAYPTYYEGMFSDLRDVMTEAVKDARVNGRGLWQQDLTTAGFELTDISTVIDEVVIMPKLFRRIVSYLGSGGDIDGFRKYLDTAPDDILLLSKCHFTHLSTVISVEDHTVKLADLNGETLFPEDLVFME